MCIPRYKVHTCITFYTFLYIYWVVLLLYYISVVVLIVYYSYLTCSGCRGSTNVIICPVLCRMEPPPAGHRPQVVLNIFPQWACITIHLYIFHYCIDLVHNTVPERNIGALVLQHMCETSCNTYFTYSNNKWLYRVRESVPPNMFWIHCYYNHIFVCFQFISCRTDNR